MRCVADPDAAVQPELRGRGAREEGRPESAVRRRQLLVSRVQRQLAQGDRTTAHDHLVANTHADSHQIHPLYVLTHSRQ